jgi:hypothetical protein
MNNPESAGGILAMAEENGPVPVAGRIDSGVHSQKRVGRLLGRIFYHGFVGLFLATIPVLFAAFTHLFPSSHNGTTSVAAWIVLAGLYTYVRVQRELMPKKGSGFPKGWGQFLSDAPKFLVQGCMLGMAVSLFFERFVAAFVVCGGILSVALFAWLHRRRLSEIEKLIEKNEQEIEKWVSDGDEEERTRRRAYVLSGALLIGAAAAGVAEYEGAPKLGWPAGLRYASYNDDEGDSWNCTNAEMRNNTDSVSYSSMTYYNPATGLPTIDNLPGSIDIAGNSWGHNSFE